MANPRKALTVWQPWAWLLAAGHKDIENRNWPTLYRGRFLIHAGKKIDPDYDNQGAMAWDWPAIAQPAGFSFGGIIGEADIVDCVTASASPWFVGPYGFVIRNARLYADPQPCRGQQGFFIPDYPSPDAPAAPTPPKPRLQGSLF